MVNTNVILFALMKINSFTCGCRSCHAANRHYCSDEVRAHGRMAMAFPDGTLYKQTLAFLFTYRGVLLFTQTMVALTMEHISKNITEG